MPLLDSCKIVVFLEMYRYLSEQLIYKSWDMFMLFDTFARSFRVYVCVCSRACMCVCVCVPRVLYIFSVSFIH
jgi:hypothetical protein